MNLSVVKLEKHCSFFRKVKKTTLPNRPEIVHDKTDHFTKLYDFASQRN